MESKLYLLKAELCGIKNIDKTITLNFYNETLRNFNPSKSNIKAIYGTNGAGKSAIINAMEIYKELVLNDNYLSDRRSISKIRELINKKTKKLKIKMTILLYENEINKKICVCTHEIHLKIKENQELYICFEKIEQIK